MSEKDRAYIHGKGLDTLREHALHFITDRLAPENPKRDGKQTPFRGHPVFIAQHATATCCRGCLQKWHGMPKGSPLTEQQISYVTDVIMAWLEEQLRR